MLGWQDETWWSRTAVPVLHTWADKSLRLVEQTVARDDPEPKALACYGLLRGDTKQVVLRFVDGRPLSTATTEFLGWLSDTLTLEGKQALLLVWDNASWHASRAVREWLREHNRRVRKEHKGVRIISFFLPIKSPWLNPIEAHWAHGKRSIAEPARLLPACELEARVYAYFGCTDEPHIAIAEQVT